MFAALVAASLLRLRETGHERPRPQQGGTRGVVADRRLYPLAVVYSVSFGFSVVVGTWAAALLVQQGVLTNGPAATVASLTLLLGVVARPLGGWIASKGARQAQAAVAVSLVAGATGTLAVAFGGSAVVAVAGTALVGVAARGAVRAGLRRGSRASA